MDLGDSLAALRRSATAQQRPPWQIDLDRQRFYDFDMLRDCHA